MAEKLTARLVGGTGGTVVKATQIALPVDNWYGGAGMWSQIVEVADASAFSKIDLQPTAAQLEALQQTGIALMVQNADGVFTVHAVGDKPTEALVLQATVTEIVRNTDSESTVISGNTVGSITGPVLYPYDE